MPTILEPGPHHPQARQASKHAALEQRVAALERNAMAIPVKGSAPTSAEGQEGSIAGDSGAVRLWVRIGSSWHYTTLT